MRTLDAAMPIEGGPAQGVVALLPAAFEITFALQRRNIHRELNESPY
jgi:hypothetical protein